MLIEGVIASAPDADRRVTVTIPTFHPDQTFGPCPYMPRAGALPTVGARCLVALDETGIQEPWVPAWDGPDGAVGGAGTMPRVTSLPGSPADGDQIALVVDAANGIAWHLRFDASLTGSKWVFLGGGALFAEILTFETTTATGYTDLATVGPSVTVPVAGTYDVACGSAARNTSAGGGAHMSLARGATAADDASRIDNDVAGASLFQPGFRARRFAGLSAGDMIVIKYRAGSGGTAGFENRFLSVTPVRVG